MEQGTATAIDIAGRRIGPGQPCFIIAEAGVNHNGSLEMARRLVDVAVQAGADAVKFQTFKAEKVISSNAPKAAYQIQATGSRESQLEMAKRLELSFESFRDLQAYCRQKRILFLSTPFDEESADFLADLDVPLFKIPSGEITNLPFLVHVARKKRPMIVSTGMSTLEEVETAVRVIEEAGNRDLVLLHCVSNYPADPADINLKTMHTMAAAFNVPVGYSDHTLGVEIACAAVALGAVVIEKHFSLDKSLPGPDQHMSLSPGELCVLVTAVRNVEAALGDGVKRPMPSEMSTRTLVRRSLVVSRDLPAGYVLKRDDLGAKRAASAGLPPACLVKVVGRKLMRSLAADSILQMEDLE